MSDIAKLTEALSDRYRIEREIGAGGMATVYLAEDLRNHRLVAVKVLRADLSALLGTERFLNEIRVTANLQHPHILPLFDSGEADGRLFYVMPYLEGEALAERIAREKQLPVEEAVRITREVASALDYAHRHGVIHRDIKPANILLQDGTALVADFGIALAVSNAGGARLTETGLSLGTPYYMSPEQATGDRQLDARSDVYSLGAVLYEMLTGDPPHTGSTAQAVIAAVVTEQPRDVAARRPRLAPHVAEAVHRALEKLPADRFPSAAEFARALEGPAASTGRTAAFRAKAHGPPRRWLPVALGLVGVAIGLAAGRLLLAPGPVREIRTRLTFTGDASFPAVTPDGHWLAYIRGGCGAGADERSGCDQDVMVQELPAGVPAVLVAGARRVGPPAWSPDGSALLLSMKPAGSENGLYLVPRTGGVARRLADDAIAWTFADDRTAAYLARRGPAIRLVDLETGDFKDSVVIGKGDWLLVSADFSSRNGRIFFGGIHGSALRGGIADRTGRILDTLDQTAAGGGWYPDGRSVLVGSIDARSLVHLWRIPVSGSGRVDGKPVELIGGMRQDEWTGIALTPTGFVVGEASRTADVWGFTAGGASRRLTHSSTWYLGPVVSPDGRTIAYVKQDAWGANVYSAPLAGGAERPVTTDSGIRQLVRWMPDSRRLSDLVLQASGTGGFTHEIVEPETGRRRAFPVAAGMIAYAWRPDGTLLAIQLDGTAFAIADTSGKTLRRFPVPDSLRPFSNLLGSPDGREAAALVGRSPQVRVVAIDLSSGAWRVVGPTGPADSTRSVILLRWARDGYLHFGRKAGSAPTELWRIPARGGTPQRVATLSVACDGATLSLADDGRTGACLVVDERPDLYLVERRR
jgi:eukaryotic-like serine/threonine-protein kinase